jgi:formate dehydrogenase alpha subunit
MTNSTPEIEDAACILITGSNTSEAHPLIASRVFTAKAKGSTLVVIDPRDIQLARMADIHLRPWPGTDVAWINGLMNVIIAEDLYDKAFVAERTEGFAELKALVAGYTPERVEGISGIPPDQLREAARAYGRAETAAILYAMGITQHTTGRDNVLSCANLAMLTGNVGRRSTGVNPLRGQNNVQGACDLGGLPNVYPGYQSVTDDAIRDNMEQAWGVPLSPEVGLTVTEMIELAYNQELKALYVMGENPMVADADINHAREALKRLDFMVVQDIFMSETAQMADVVLPAAAYAEKDGTFTATDRRIQRVRKAVEPPGEARQDWEIVCDLARRMGARGFDFESPEQIMTEVAAVTPIYGGVSFERLARGEVLQWPIPTLDHPGTPYLHKDKFSRGLGKFHAIDYQEADELPDEDYPLMLTTGRLMFHWHTGTMTRRSDKLEQEVPEAYVELHPRDAAEIGLNGSRWVRVSSRRGEIEVAVRLTDKIKPGLVFIPFHFAEAAANVLTNSAFDPIAKIPEYKVCAVRLEAIPGAGVG